MIIIEDAGIPLTSTAVVDDDIFPAVAGDAGIVDRLADVGSKILPSDIDAAGRVSTRAFRTYHLPQFGDVPRTEVLFAASHDPLGPLGAKPMSEAPFNPVAPALANAVRDATGRRLTDLPFTRDRVFAELSQYAGQDAGQHSDPDLQAGS